MRRIFLLFVIIAVSFVSVFAQKIVTGKVTSDAGEDLPGVTVVAKGTNVATITDLTGSYSIGVPEEVTTLIFSYIGFQDTEKPVADVVNVQMKSDTELEEVVVTALGIKRDVKALGYSATTVKSDELTKTKDRSALNALQGKVAGVNISSASGAPGASTRVIIRGFSSISGSNQPLFIVDGVPLNNSSSGSTSINGGTDFGNGVNDLNPDDIENITVLKGSSGVALYGSRAANGVIIITTKTGRQSKTKGLEITVSSSFDLSEVMRLPNWQNEYGQGFYGRRDIRENTSWGPKFDGEMRYWDFVVDIPDSISARRRIKPYSALPNNVRNFFDFGRTFNNSIAFAGGNESANFYMSYSNINDNGIMPLNFDIYDRHSLALRGEGKLSNKLTVSGSMNYIKKMGKYVMTGQGAVSVYNQILQIPRDIPITEVSDYKGPWDDLDNYYSPYTVNPYLTLNEFQNENNQDRIFGKAQFNYNINEYLSLMYRIGTDITNEQRHEHQPILEPNHVSGLAGSWVNTNEGSVTESTRFRREINSDIILTFNKNLSDNISLNAMVGNNIYQSNGKTVYTYGYQLVIPDYYHIDNLVSLYGYEGEYKKRLVGAYAQADIALYKMVYVSLMARNDWSSSLPLQNNSYFYPGVNVSYDFTETFPSIKKIVSFGKIRFGWAQTGNDAQIYQVYSTLDRTGFYDGYGGTGLRFPLSNGISSYSISNLIANPDLQPEIGTEFEIGTDLRFYGGRINLDFTYYNKVNDKQILTTQYAASTGFSRQTVNNGKISNKGFEILLRTTPVKKDNFQWDLDLNYTKNNSLLEELPEGTEELTITGVGMPATGYTSLKLIPGYPISVITVNDVRRVEGGEYDGSIIVDNNGLPQTNKDSTIIVGSTNYNYILGVSTSLKYKNLSFSAAFDIRQGGYMYSRTAEMTFFSGTNMETLYNDRQPFIVEGSVVEVLNDDNEVVGYEENTVPVVNSVDFYNMHSYWGQGGTELNKKFVIDKSFVKLRSASIAYQIPKRFIQDIFINNISVALYGRNLLVWTPSDNQWIDPEATSFGNDLAADYGEWGSTPSIRSYGFKLNFTF